MKHDRAYKTGTMRSMYGPGPEGEICKSCTHLICHVRDRRWYKCKAYGVSSSEATDWGCTWPACGLFTYDPEAELPPHFVTVIENRRHALHPREREPELPGQIDMDELMKGKDVKTMPEYITKERAMDCVYEAFTTDANAQDLYAIRRKIAKEPGIGWVSVKDRLPETRHAVLAFSPQHNNIWALCLYEDGNWYYWMDSGRRYYDPDWMGPITHWMPMPILVPPEEVNGNARQGDGYKRTWAL